MSELTAPPFPFIQSNPVQNQPLTQKVLFVYISCHVGQVRVPGSEMRPIFLHGTGLTKDGTTSLANLFLWKALDLDQCGLMGLFPKKALQIFVD